MSDEERAAEMKRRDDAIRLEEESRKAAKRRAQPAELARAETSCLHCGRPMHGGRPPTPNFPCATFASDGSHTLAP